MEQDVLIKVEGISKKFCRDLKTSLRYGVQDVRDELFGEDLPIDDPEISRAYLLFADTLDAGLTNIANDAESTSLLSNCRATKDLKTGMDLPGEQQITTDETYVVRAWMAVVTYLLSDYKFLFE